DVASRYSDATKKLGEMVTSTHEVAKDLNDEGQAVARKQTIYVIGGSFLAIILGVSFGYLVARFLAKGVNHIAEVALPPASWRLQARAKLDTEDELGQMAK